MDAFFANSDGLDYYVLRPLSHFTLNWELTWDAENGRYREEESSFVCLLNALLEEIELTTAPEEYHPNEDKLAQEVVKSLKWPISKVGKRWVGADYESILTQGGFGDFNQANLIAAVASRVKFAKKFGQEHFDAMELGHKRTLCFLLTAILYHRSSLLD